HVALDVYARPDGRAHSVERLGQSSGSSDVIVLHQYCIVKPEAMIRAAAASHRVFLERAQTRRGLARLDYLGMSAFNRRHIAGGESGDAAQAPEEVCGARSSGRASGCCARVL